MSYTHEIGEGRFRQSFRPVHRLRHRQTPPRGPAGCDHRHGGRRAGRLAVRVVRASPEIYREGKPVPRVNRLWLRQVSVPCGRHGAQGARQSGCGLSGRRAGLSRQVRAPQDRAGLLRRERGSAHPPVLGDGPVSWCAGADFQRRRRHLQDGLPRHVRDLGAAHGRHRARVRHAWHGGKSDPVVEPGRRDGPCSGRGSAAAR
jgi:hypothetical protein